MEIAGQPVPVVMSGWQTLLDLVYGVLQPFLLTALVTAVVWGAAELRRRGYQSTYADALARALGTGVLAAQDKGLDPFGPSGRKVVVEAGVNYLQSTVGHAAAQLGITTDADHADRVLAQMGSVKAAAAATAQAIASSPTVADITDNLTQGLQR